MRLRNRRAMSVLLAASMVFSMNTAAFAEEIPAEAVEKAAVEAEAKAEETAGAEAEAVTEETAGAEIKSFTPYDPYDYDKDFNPTTTITYEKDSTNKKATVGDIVTITGVTDPVSWNGFYGKDLIYTVLFGNDATDSWLNNKSAVTVSSDSSNPFIKGLFYDVDNNGFTNFDSIPVKEGEAYILVAYGLDGGAHAYVAGYDDAAETVNGETLPYSVPIIDWDGRKVAFNKSGINKYSKGNKEALNVAAALVTYSNGTVKEVPGFSISVKVDSKNQKASSVEEKYTLTEKTYKNWGFNDKDEYVLMDDKAYFREHAAIGTLPSFTISAKIKGKDGKAYNKDIKNILKSQSYYFGIKQKAVAIDSDYAYASKFKDILGTGKEDNGKISYLVSSGDVEKIEKNITADLLNGSYFDADMDSYSFDANYENNAVKNYNFTIEKFNGKKANLAQYGNIGDSKKGYTWGAVNSLKLKKDFTLTDGTLAGETVQALEFVDGGNYVYTPEMTKATPIYSDGKRTTTIVPTFEAGLAGIGFKYAFRVSPTNKKMFRAGIYQTSNVGFVYSAEK